MSDELFEIKDLTVDDAALRAEVARRAAARGLALPSFPRFGAASEVPAGAEDDPLLQHLREASALVGSVNLTMELAASEATRVPVLGALWGLIRRQMHALILFYVGRLAGHTVAVDHHLVNALNEAVRRQQALEADVSALRQRVADLEDGRRAP